MSNLSIPKRIAVIAIIAIIILLPAFLAYNAQSELDASGAPLPPGLQAGLDGDGDGTPGGGKGGAGGDGTGANGGDQITTAPVKTPEPVNADIIESIRVSPTPKPEPTPTPKWVPETPATDGVLLIGNLVEDDSVNVLILGIDRSAHLADTIGVVSISRSAKTVKLIMFPRDIYIGYADDVMENVKKIRHHNLPGEYKINNTYNVAKNTEKYSDVIYNGNRFENHSFDFLAQVIYEKFDIYVDDFVQINTYGLVKLVDAFGGVRVYVPTYMRYHDPDQNLKINLSKGTQYLNGTQAEGFVRFRQGYDSKGNFSITADRTANQIAFLKAFYEQHAKLSNIDKIPAVIDILKKNIVHSITMDELFTKYTDILTQVVKESYAFESIQFDTGTTKKFGSTYYTIKSIKTEPD